MEKIVNSGSPLEDGEKPSLYYYAGMAHQMLGDLEAAVAAYGIAIKYDYSDIQAWLNLGDSLLYQFLANKALAAFGEAVRLSGGPAKAPSGVLAKLHRVG